VFDVPGGNKNSIQCVRESPLFDVLIFASEDKSLNESQALDHEVEMKRAKMKKK